MDRENPAKLYMPPNPFGVNQVYYERIQNMRLLDDALMTAALADNIPATQLILRIILGKDDLVITSVRAQSEYKNLRGHSLRLDVDAVDSEGRKYDIEIQRDNREAKPERGRYHMAIIDSASLEENHSFTDLPTVYVLFITESDYYKKGMPIYHVNRMVEETGEQYGDRAHILYVNGSYKGENPLGLLMADFRERNPGRMHYAELAERVSNLKNSEDEVKKMCRAMEITYEEGRSDGLREGQSKGRMEGRMEGYVRNIRSLMRRRGISAEEAMDDLEILGDERIACVEQLKES